MTKDFTFSNADLVAERERVKKLYSRNKHTEFTNPDAFANWWIEKLKEQNYCCIYCETPIRLIRELIDEKLLAQRKVGYGYRGPCLELERRDPRGKYEADNCALSCYYCNNDKSYVYPEDQYREFLAPAKRNHFAHLAKKLRAAGPPRKAD